MPRFETYNFDGSRMRCPACNSLQVGSNMDRLEKGTSGGLKTSASLVNVSSSRSGNYSYVAQRVSYPPVKKDLSMRRHVCGCGVNMDRDENVAINILRTGLRMAGHARTGEATPETLVEMEEDQRMLASIDEARIPRL